MLTSTPRKLTTMFVQILVLCGLLIGATGQPVPEFSVRPINTAVTTQDSAQLNCSVTNKGDEIVEWLRYGGPGDQSTGRRLYLSAGGIEDNVRTEYGIDENIAEGRYNLIMKAARREFAVDHVCKLLVKGEEAHARVVVVDRVTCEPDPGVMTVVAGTEVAFTCFTEFGGYLAPSLDWYNSRGQWMPAYNDSYEATSRYVANVTTTAVHDGMEFTCQVTFEGGPDVPKYMDQCSTYVNVEHGASNIQLSPSPGSMNGTIEVRVGGYINCTAQGKPAPMYFFEKVYLDEDGPEIVEGHLLPIDENMAGQRTYRCMAMNTVDGQPRETSREFTFITDLVSSAPRRTSNQLIITGFIVLLLLIPSLNYH